MGRFPGVPGFLLAGHGLYGWGSSIAEAKRHIEVFEFLMECRLWIERSSSDARYNTLEHQHYETNCRRDRTYKITNLSSLIIRLS